MRQGDDEDAVREAGAALLGQLRPGTRVAPMRLGTACAHVFYRLDEAEDARRRSVGAAALCAGGEEGGDGRRSVGGQLALLDLLLGLPTGLPVPLRSLTARERAALRRCPPGAVRIAEGAVVRRAVVPLRVDLALVATPRLSGAAVERSGRFASGASAVGLLVTGARPDPYGLLRAEWYGHGVVHKPSGAPLRLVALPRVLVDVRHSAAVWRFAERIHQQLPGPAASTLTEALPRSPGTDPARTPHAPVRD